MGKKLIIAEKPSVALDISKALGGFTKHDDYYESDDYVLSSAVGHLLALICPEEFEVKRGKWTFAHLPVIPPHFDLQPIEKSAPRLKVLQKLLRRKDVDGLINACDAGREGELIFNYIAQYAKAKVPVQRLWLQSMTKEAIKDGFDHLRDGADMQGLADAAVCRSESDWLVGINGTRAMSAFNSKTGGFHLTTVGRVQTPTLSLVVEREKEIRAFIPLNYWEVEGEFQAADGNYTGRWFDEAFKKGEDEHARAERLWQEQEAAAIRSDCLGKPGVVTDTAKPENRLSPLLFNLTSMQREANTRFGFSAKTTLSIAQALYEHHKVLTYPRTDSRALPEDYLPTVHNVLAGLPDIYAPFANEIVKEGWVKPNKRIFNNTKISDHFAIIPTGTVPKSLSEVEAKLYDFVVRRFLSVFYPAAEYLVTTRITRVGKHPFKTEGKVLVKKGWLTVYGKEESDEETNLPAVTDGEQVQTEDVRVKTSATRPPARYSEATLLSAMESAGKRIDDDELRAAMAGRGLGTPATRAQIIEGLLAEQYLLREGRELIPMAKAFNLMTLLEGLGITALTSPELTGEWESKLGSMERGELSRKQFMAEIAQMTEDMVAKAKNFEHDTIPGDFGTLTTPCPKCGGVMKETYKKFQCDSCDYGLWKTVAGRQFEGAEIETLIKERQVGPLNGFRNKMGRPFAALIKLNDEHQPAFDFGNSDDSSSEPVDFSGVASVGKCPKCVANVYPYVTSYVCEKSVGPEKSCTFRSGQIILQHQIDTEQMSKLLTAGKTDLLKEFVSSRTRRKFSAFLALDKDGKVCFEFEPRPIKAGAEEAKPTKKAAAKKPAAKKATKAKE
ncbi:MAG: DNA topoisomerase III, Burkholderia type [Fluviibacter phosphoraccumulans EoVTN8]